MSLPCPILHSPINLNFPFPIFQHFYSVLPSLYVSVWPIVLPEGNLFWLSWNNILNKRTFKTFYCGFILFAYTLIQAICNRLIQHFPVSHCTVFSNAFSLQQQQHKFWSICWESQPPFAVSAQLYSGFIFRSFERFPAATQRRSLSPIS